MDKSQGWKSVLKIIIPYLIIVSIFQLGGVYLAGESMHQVLPETTQQQTIVSFFSLAGTVFTVWLFCKYIDGRSLDTLGFDTLYIVRDLFYGLIMGLVIMALGLVFLLQIGQVSYQGTSFNLVELLCSILLYIFVAFTEELLLRGYILNNLLDSFNQYVALTISAVIFSLMHAANPNVGALPFINIFLAGILLGMSFIYTRKLWFPIALHFSWNFCQGVLCGFKVSGEDFYNLTLIKAGRETIWNGGKFGFEGSLTCTILAVLAIGVVHLIYHSKTDEYLAEEEVFLEEAE